MNLSEYNPPFPPSEQAGIVEVLRSPTVRRALLVGCLLHLWQQVCGINTVM